MNIPETGLIVYLIVINALGFIFMGADKRRAVMHQWRIKERTLFIFALLGGSAGSILGLLVFHHKTKHKKFAIGMPMILVIQILIVLLLYQRR